MHEAAAAAEYFPLTQFVHALSPPAENVPAAHSRQSVATEFIYRPGEHGVHKFCAPFETAPAGHAEQQDLKEVVDGSQSSADGYCKLYALMAPEEEEEQDALAAEFSFP